MNIIESYATVAEGSEDGYTDPTIYTTTNRVSEHQRPCVSVVSESFSECYREALAGKVKDVTDVYPPDAIVRVSTYNDDADLCLQIRTASGIQTVLLDAVSGARLAAQLLGAIERVTTPVNQ